VEKFLHNFFMATIGGATEAIVLNQKLLPQALKALNNFITMGLGRFAPLLGGALNFLAMFIGPGDEEGGMALEAMEAGESVSRDRGVSAANVGDSVNVVQGGCNGEGL